MDWLIELQIVMISNITDANTTAMHPTFFVPIDSIILSIEIYKKGVITYKTQAIFLTWKFLNLHSG